VDELGSPRLRHSRSDEVLPMAANWERGLALCGGEFVTVLGDDDALVPSSLAALRKLIDATQAELITWRAHVYWWPDTIVPWNRNRLYVNLGGGARLVKSRSTLERFYRGALGFNLVPTIYTSFFHRRLIDEARSRYGGFFVPADAAPDVSSGILGLHLTQRFAVSGRPLSIRGNSRHSNGTAQWARSLGAEQREVFFREERVGLQGFMHRSLVPSPNLGIVIASAKLKCKEVCFPGDTALSVDLPGVVRELIANLNHDPDAYEENLHDAQALADKLGLRLEAGEIPAKLPRARKASWGPMPNEDGEIDRICVNCDLVGVQHVAGAARLVESLMPPLDSFLESTASLHGELDQRSSYDSWQAGPSVAASERPSMLRDLLSGLVGRRPR
jgi:hypothetical protein